MSLGPEAYLKITAPFALTAARIGDLVTGQPNPFYDLVTMLDRSIPEKQRGRVGNKYVWEGDLLLAMFSQPVCELIVGQGGDVEGWPFWFEVDPDSVLPSDVPGSRHQVENENGETISGDLKTWREWMPENHEVQDLGGRLFVKGVHRERYLPASEWKPLVDSGIKIIDEPSFAALQNSLAPQPDS